MGIFSIFSKDHQLPLFEQRNHFFPFFSFSFSIFLKTENGISFYCWNKNFFPNGESSLSLFFFFFPNAKLRFL